MLLKRLLLGVLLLLTALVFIPGCATNSTSKDDYTTRYRNASDECIRFGYRRDSPEFKKCVEERIGSREESSSSEQD